jgi:hypothetical protein
VEENYKVWANGGSKNMMNSLFVQAIVLTRLGQKLHNSPKNPR